jgi:DNA-binding CsgD family transcriptional regulator
MTNQTDQNGHFSSILNLKERLRAFPLLESAFLAEAVHGLFAPIPHLVYPYTGFSISFPTLKYVYVGENVESLTGYSQKEMLDDGVALTYHRMHPEDQANWEKGFEFLLNTLQESEREKIPHMQFSMNWRFMRKDGSYVTLLQQFVIPEVDDDHNPVLQYGIISDITAYYTSEVLTLTIGRPHPNGNELIYERISFGRKKDSTLSSREKDILRLVCQGLSSKRIADELSISAYTVNNHRAKIMVKTKSKNVADLAGYAMRHGIV